SLGIELDGTAVSTIFQHFSAESRLHNLAIGSNAFPSLATERSAGLHLQAQLLSRLRQIGGLKTGLFQLLDHFDETLLDLAGLDIAFQLVLEAGETRHFGRLHIQ